MLTRAAQLVLLRVCHAAPHHCQQQLAAGAAAAWCSTRDSSSSSSSSIHGTASSEQQDAIVLTGLVFHGFHGALAEENVLGQKFVVDATLWTSLAAAGASDALGDTIDYAAVYTQIREVVQGPPHALQEAVAEQLCQRLLCHDARIDAVRVYLRKPHVALPGVLDSVGVQVTRRREKP